MNNIDSRCSCGRSPTGKCCGWHKLTEEQYKQAKADYEYQSYLKETQEIWNDSCTTKRS